MKNTVFYIIIMLLVVFICALGILIIDLRDSVHNMDSMINLYENIVKNQDAEIQTFNELVPLYTQKIDELSQQLEDHYATMKEAPNADT